MDKQPPKQMHLWLTIDVTLIVVGRIVVSLGAWLGYMDLPLNIMAKARDDFARVIGAFW